MKIINNVLLSFIAFILFSVWLFTGSKLSLIVLILISIILIEGD